MRLDSATRHSTIGEMIYVCAGMPRSGSTWVFNAVRLLLQRAEVPDLAAGWIAERAHLLAHDNSVIKIHSFDVELAARADVVLTSHRDLRDVAASLQRKFKTGFSPRLIHEVFADYVQWSKIAAYDLHYEDLLLDNLSELKAIATVLKLPSTTTAQLPCAEVLQEIRKERFCENRSTTQRYDFINLLHDGHITDGRHGSWENFVPNDVVTAIENEFRDWMIAKGYISREQASPTA